MGVAASDVNAARGVEIPRFQYGIGVVILFMNIEGPMTFMASIGDTILGRQRAIVLFGLTAIVGLAAIYTILGPGMESSALAMTTMSGDMLMAPALWTQIHALLVFLMWWIMMVAMMVPAAVPMILLHGALERRGTPAGALAASALFISGYLLVWGAFSAGATLLQWALQSAGALSPMMQIGNQALGGLVLIAAGLYQFTPLKRACLARCQNPVRFLVAHRRPGPGGALRLGIRHGAFCVGCCVFLMALLFIGGIMNLYWIGGLSIYVLLERFLASRRWLRQSAGFALAISGVALMVTTIQA